MNFVSGITAIHEWNRLRRMADTERGDQFRCDITMLECLIELDRNNDLSQDDWRRAMRS